MRRRGLLGLALAPLAACDGPPVTPDAWSGPSSELRDPRLRALAWARLAPSPGNAQPWRATLAGADRLILREDPTRALPAVDPDGRQARIALGAFLELAVMAAAAEGRRCEVAPLPDAAVALRLAAVSGLPPDPLFAALPRRRTTRLAYDLLKPVEPAEAAALLAAAGTAVRFGCAVAPERVGRLRELARRAHEQAQEIAAVARAEAAWLRLDETAEDGIPVRGAPVRWARELGLLSAGQLADPASLAFRVARLQWANLFAATASFGWIATAADGAADRLAAGRAYQRVDLAAAALGLAIHPVSEALGDVPALDAARGELERLLGAPGRVQMLFRLGRAGPQPPSPRRPDAAFMTMTVE